METGSRPTSGSKRRQKSSDPFYAVPKDRDTASEIINEARTSLKMVTTKRPFTPKESKRTLFGEPPGPTFSSRPPSSFSLSSKHFDPTDSRPPSGTKLSPLEHKPLLPIAPALPAAPNQKRRSKESNEKKPNKGFARANSVDASMNSWNASLDTSPSGNVPERRSDSAPKERPPVCPTSSRNVDSGYLTSESRGNSGGSDNSKLASQNRFRGSVSPLLASEKRPPEHSLKSPVQVPDANYDVWGMEVEPLLANLVKDGCPEELLNKVKELDGILTDHALYRERNSIRSAVLKSVFKLLDVENAELQMKLSELILKYRVNGNNLNNVCKLVFKLSKNEENDSLFADSSLLDLLLDVILATEEQSYDVLVYVFGALKFLSSNLQLLAKLIDLGLIPTVSNFLSNTPKLTGDKTINILVQVTSCIRNIAEDPMNGSALVRYRVFSHLLTILGSHYSQTEVTLNVCRTFSRLVTNPECCNAITRCETWSTVLKSALEKHHSAANISVRIIYFLSIAAVTGPNAEVNRVVIFKHFESVLHQILRLFLSREDIKSLPEKSTEAQKDADSEDVLIKLMGLQANLSLSETVGLTLCKSDKFLSLAFKVLANKPVLEHRELVLNTVVVMHNLSYFGNMESSSAINEREIQLTQLLVNVMMPKELQSFDENLEVMTECVRVYANLTRSERVRKFMSENQIDLLLFTLVECGRRELLFNVVGVLVNMTLDTAQCDKICDADLIGKLILNLRDFGVDDWLLSSAVCKIVWNFLACCKRKDPISKDDVHSLKEVLNFLILEARSSKEAFVDESGDVKMTEVSDDSHIDEFLSVAGNLVQKLYGILPSV